MKKKSLPFLGTGHTPFDIYLSYLNIMKLLTWFEKHILIALFFLVLEHCAALEAQWSKTLLVQPFVLHIGIYL